MSKPRVPIDPETVLITPESRQLVEVLLGSIFVARLERDGLQAREMVPWVKSGESLAERAWFRTYSCLVKRRSGPGHRGARWGGSDPAVIIGSFRDICRSMYWKYKSESLSEVLNIVFEVLTGHAV